MRALIVFETWWGNTEQVARAMAAALASDGEASVVPVDEAPRRVPADVELLVVGGPTHAFGLTSPQTREQARQQGATVTARSGLREWLAQLAAPEQPVPAACFDTRVDRPRLPGSAARAACRRLVRLGFTRLADPETFRVQGTSGPLLDGELERARAWAQSLRPTAEAARTFRARGTARRQS